MEEQTESVPSKTPYDGVIKQAAQRYAIDENLIRAIIKVESNFRVNAVSKSNAIGLMQVKASTAGRDAYRLQGKAGQPTTSQLKDPAINIDVGTAYIRFIQENHLVGIRDPKVLYYATVVAYVNGAGALLRIFDKNRHVAIDKINELTAEEFYQHIQTKHPNAQAPRYLWKIKNAYNSIAMMD
ncbi:MAG: transglycosylase SLT domain-containing protein [Candidatus Arsenophonus phytopathogenicus]